MKILLTGFESFGGSDTNVSSEVASMFSLDSIDGCEIVVEQLPVSFKRVGKILSQLIELHNPDVILMLGQAGKREKISIERIAINLMDTSMVDNDGFSPTDLPIIPNGEIAYFSTLPIKEIIAECRKENIDIVVSNSAGLYVCNCAFYNAIHLAHQKELDCKIGFIHLPKINDRDNKPIILKQMHKAIKIALKKSI